MTGAAVDGSGVQASGMWPSPASRPEVGIEADPAGAGQIDLAPGVQVGEVRSVPDGPSSDFTSGVELDQVAGDEARREAEVAQQLHQQPAGVAARAASACASVSSGVCTPGSMRIR